MTWTLNRDKLALLLTTITSVAAIASLLGSMIHWLRVPSPLAKDKPGLFSWIFFSWELPASFIGLLIYLILWLGS